MKVADWQKSNYDKQSLVPSFTMNDKVWLSVPTAGKLQPSCDGGWKVTSVKSSVTFGISNGRKSKMVTVTDYIHQFQAASNSSESMVTNSAVPLSISPQVEHFIVKPSHLFKTRVTTSIL